MSRTLGANWDAAGTRVDFKVFSKNASRIQLEVFSQATGESAKISLPLSRTGDGVWSGSVSAAQLQKAGIKGPVFYGYRAWGPNFIFDPRWTPGSSLGFKSDVDDKGNRFNPNKLCLDPYALEQSHDPIGPHNRDFTPFKSGPKDRDKDSALLAPKGVALKPQPVPSVPKPTRAFKDDTIYEVHVKGLTANDTNLPPEKRGTYAGAATKAKYLKELGITAVEFLPVQEAPNDQNDLVQGTEGDNYWGYMTNNFFSPDRRYASDKSPGGPTREFREMVEAFHKEGIKVFIDVVYNHTAEGGTHSEAPEVATLTSFRGIDNASYYQLADDARYFYDNTGTGANINATNPAVRNLIVDSLKYWKDEMGVDGFRFDLLSVLGNSVERGGFNYDRNDPNNALNRIPRELGARPAEGGPGVDLIAEPWAIGGNSYQVGNFPDGWAEWNGKYRDSVRELQNLQGIKPTTPGQRAGRTSGSSDLFEDDGRKPPNSVNIIVTHDGLSLRDLHAYNAKNNMQPWPFGASDGGEDHNASWDQGGDPAKQRQASRTALALLMTSAGVPMITGGDEFYRTQYGNNNAYNLDSDKIWLNWDDKDTNKQFFEFSRALMRFRQEHPALRPAEFFTGKDKNGDGVKDVTWYKPDGTEADGRYMDNPDHHFLAYRVDGTEVSGETAKSILVAHNASPNGESVQLPPARAGSQWVLVSDTSHWMENESNFAPPEGKRVDGHYHLHDRAVAIFVEQPIPDKEKEVVAGPGDWLARPDQHSS
jgi:isoamylase